MKANIPLLKLIFDDIFARQKLLFLLVFAIIGSALATIKVVYDTRNLVSEYYVMIGKLKILDDEYANLVLEENTLSERSKIEAKARNLHLQPLKDSQEYLISK